MTSTSKLRARVAKIGVLACSPAKAIVAMTALGFFTLPPIYNTQAMNCFIWQDSFRRKLG
ncbi:hypothetical protein [Dendronalium sp. ChiSLP03b]|uniref:hypothetical protein n=1 Tax=Dendronalium sp. ChiSLP03b TaxID=3075381 RepID=UPI002AD31E4E|nr:hypothetical protein [Dendronalium sp. ChiSLP03b]MDZ8208733.1 hypothetical protein [Dendronalium sp. ChiSLP03b]